MMVSFNLRVKSTFKDLPNRSMSTSSSRVKAEEFVFVDIHEDVLKMKNFDSKSQWEKYLLRSTCQALFCMLLLAFRAVPLEKCTWKYDLTWFIHKQPSELRPQKMSGFVYPSWLDFPSPFELSKKINSSKSSPQEKTLRSSILRSSVQAGNCYCFFLCLKPFGLGGVLYIMLEIMSILCLFAWWFQATKIEDSIGGCVQPYLKRYVSDNFILEFILVGTHKT